MAKYLPRNYQLALLKATKVDRLFKTIPPTETNWVIFVNRLLKEGWTEEEIDEAMIDYYVKINTNI